ncbi:peptidase [Candidatus Viridilinea mediisalina]|uniref:Peptidase n=1 Tax=Candidatus Viridilinea mediisalina TaxID=2024553 RepID=A0A2A6RHY0_9CHLR|nr:peptidase [Candidatus Viridilinea mediisalina]PDW02622.1 hypothetical protein CJ255_12935 [Candidatus Viridilinea mediisalina]
MQRMTSPLLMLLLMTMLLAPLAQQPTAVAEAYEQSNVSPLNTTPTVLPPYAEQEAFGAQQNDTPETAERIGPVSMPPPVSWQQVVTGTIGRSSDIDYFSFVVPNPASRVQITLSDLPADYDLVFGGGLDPANETLMPPPDFDAGMAGLEGITQVGGSISAIGGSISAIGGSISAIGGSISAIGGSISAIGGSISAIGGSISAISINAGTTPEEIDTFVWQPGVYFVAVAPKNGEFSQSPYRLEVTVLGSALDVPPPAPRVQVNLAPSERVEPEAITTLYLYHPQRLAARYGLPPDGDLISSLTQSLQSLALYPPNPTNRGAEYGLVIDLSELRPVGAGAPTLAEVYARWDANRNNPLYANYIARFIDNIIKATIAGETLSSPNFVLGSQTAPVAYPNVRNIVLVGGDDIFPFFRLPDLTTIANEADYLDYTAEVAGQAMFDPNQPLGAALRYRMMLSDNPYGTDRPYRFYGAPLFLPNRAVGRLVETPAEILAYLNTYTHGDFHHPEPYNSAPATAAQLQSAYPTLIDLRGQQYWHGEEEPHWHGEEEPPVETLAFVSGYDFLEDQAEAIGSIFSATGLISTEYTTLINNQWQRPDLERDWFDQRLERDLPITGTVAAHTQPQIRLSSVNAHFDHWQVLPANEERGTFLAQRLLGVPYDPDQWYYSRYFARTLGYSVGCHSGYNVPVSALNRQLNGRSLLEYAADFPQAKLHHGGNWIGNTGYGYGITDGIDYSERLAVLLTQELARRITMGEGDTTPMLGHPTIGEALMLAKQRYVRNASSLNEYDYKILSVMNLYGLPFIAVAVRNPLDPPQEDPAPERPNVPLETPAPRANTSTGQLTRIITFTINFGERDFVEIPRTNSRLLQLNAENFVVTDSFVLNHGFPEQTPRVFNDNQVGAPALPSFAYDISALNQAGTERMQIRDVVFVGGSYGALDEFKPQITQIVTETETPITETSNQPVFTAGAGIWFPAKFFGHSSVGTGELQRDQLTSFAAQFRADEDGVSGVLRPYSQMVFRILYDDPSINTNITRRIRADDRAPVIESVQIRDASGDTRPASDEPSSLLIVTARDEDGAGNPQTEQLEVVAIFAQAGEQWVEIRLSPDASNPERFTATLTEEAAEARFIVRATDPAGNSTYFTAGGRFTTFVEEEEEEEEEETPNRIFLPLVRR